MKGLNNYKLILPLSMLNMTIKITTLLLIYKIIKIGPFSASTSTLIIPFWFFIGDIITEIYGYNISKKILWYTIFLQMVFALFCFYIVKIPSHPNFLNYNSYDNLFLNLPRVSFASTIAILIGGRINAYFISNWKILLNYCLVHCL